MNGNGENILVKAFVRQRPLTTNDLVLSNPVVVENAATNEIVIKYGSVDKKYKFDRVFGPEASQLDVFNIVVAPLISYVISGYNCTVFAYGQTGTGKTHTMVGSNITPATDFNNDPQIGMIPRAAAQLFLHLRSLDPERFTYTVTLSFVEIYNEDVRDLLVKESEPLKVYDDPENKGSVYIKSLSEVTATNTNEVYEWLHLGNKERQTAATNLNRQSSRSHTLFTLLVHTKEMTASGEEIIKTGKLHLIDLAGSENIEKSGAKEMRAREAGTINKSLLTLGKVIKALAQKMQHIPYRDSKLTRILQDSLGGNSRTCMIATFVPCKNALDETISTLDYANVARRVANCPHANISRKQVSILKGLKSDVANLRQELAAARTGEGFYMSQQNYNDLEFDARKKTSRVIDLVNALDELEDYMRMKEKQYRDLEESFRRTQSYLENRQEELKKTEEEKVQNQCLINYMKNRTETLKTSADALLQVCEKSSKIEALYHGKYESQCEITTQNAIAAKDTFLTSQKALREIQNFYSNFEQIQGSHLDQLDETTFSLTKEHDKNLAGMKGLVDEIQSNSIDCSTLVYDSNNTVNYVNSVYDSTSELQLRKHHDIKNNVENLNGHVKKLNEASSSGAAFSSHLIHNGCNEQEQYVSRTVSYLNDTYKKACDTHSLLLNQGATNKNMSNSIIKELESYNATQEELCSQLLSMKPSLNQIRGSLQLYEKNLPLEQLRVALRINMNVNSEDEQVYLDMIQETVDKVDRSKGECELKVASDKYKILQYLSGLVQTSRNNLTHYNAETKKCVSGWIQRMNTIKNSFFENVSVFAQIFNRRVENFSNSAVTHDSDIRMFMERSLEEIEQHKENVVPTAHVGDTPVKETYNYPKNIPPKLSDRVVLRNFRRSNENNQ